MPHLQLKVNLSSNRCPDADTICAVVDGEASDWIRGVFAEHLTHCPQCSELYRRVCAVSNSSIAEQDTDWTSVEKRLGNRFEAFLASKASVQRQQSKVSLRSRRKSSWEVVTAWRIPLAVGFAAVLVLVAAGLIVRRPSVPSQQTAAQAMLPLHPAASPAQQTSTPQKPSAISNTPLAAKGNTPLEELRMKRGTTSERSTELGPANTPEVASRAISTPTDTILQAPVARTGENRTAAAKLHTQPSAGTRTAALVSPYPRPATGSTNPSVSAGAGLKLPVSFRLESGTRLWISLQSVNRHPNGNFTFVGTLLLPVTQAKSIRLDQGTEIHGSGNVNQKAVSVVIGRLIVQGVPYSVARAPLQAHSPGGTAVQFDSGQVLEMWLTSTLIFARVPEEAAQH